MNEWKAFPVDCRGKHGLGLISEQTVIDWLIDFNFI